MTDQTKYTQKLKGAKVLVIGGTSGMGFATAEALLESGCIVTISSSNKSRVEQKVEALKKSYPSASSRISGCVCNLGDEAAVEDNITSLLEQCGTLDHIVYTASDALNFTPLSELTIPKIHQMGLLRYFAPMMLAKIAPKYLVKSHKSSITLTTGAVSERPIDGWAIVNAYATGLQGLTRGLALDMKPIRVNLVSPGVVNTELWSTGGMPKEQQEAMFKKTEEVLPTGHVPGPEEIAEAFLYLLKDTNITGTMISTNGGHLLLGPSLS